jgi:hypothetical protein
MSNFSSDVFARAMRLVVPMRREFGKNIDVQNFLYNPTYAKEVLDMAGSSQNEKVKENVEYLGRMILGPHPSELPLPEYRSTVGDLSKKPLSISEAVAAENPGTIASNSTESTKGPSLQSELTSEYTAGAR